MDCHEFFFFLYTYVTNIIDVPAGLFNASKVLLTINTKVKNMEFYSGLCWEFIMNGYFRAQRDTGEEKQQLLET